MWAKFKAIRICLWILKLNKLQQKVVRKENNGNISREPEKGNNDQHSLGLFDVH